MSTTEQEQKFVDELIKSYATADDQKTGESKASYDLRKEKEREALNNSKPKAQ